MFSIAYGFMDLLSRSLTLHRDTTELTVSFKYKYSRGVERLSAVLGHRPGSAIFNWNGFAEFVKNSVPKRAKYLRRRSASFRHVLRVRKAPKKVRPASDRQRAMSATSTTNASCILQAIGESAGNTPVIGMPLGSTPLRLRGERGKSSREKVRMTSEQLFALNRAESMLCSVSK